MKPSIFITGGCGYLGTRLASRYLEMGHDVVAFDLAKSPYLPQKAVFVKGDVRDLPGMTAASKGAGIFHHLVGIMPQARAGRDLMRAINVEGTENALKAASANGIKRFVYLSSSEVYGAPETMPMKEEHPKNPIGEYGRNKVETEALCIKYMKEKGLETVMIRPSTLVGAEITERMFLRLMGMLAKNAPLTYPGKGNTRFQMTAVSDCVEACILAGEKPGVAGEAFNIAAENTPTWLDLAKEIKRRTGNESRLISIPVWLVKGILSFLDLFGASPLEKDHFMLMDRDIVMDCSKAKKLLGWTPKKSDIDMVIETYEWFVKTHR